jgi:hypothetical protein
MRSLIIGIAASLALAMALGPGAGAEDAAQAGKGAPALPKCKSTDFDAEHYKLACKDTITEKGLGSFGGSSGGPTDTGTPANPCPPGQQGVGGCLDLSNQDTGTQAQDHSGPTGQSEGISGGSGENCAMSEATASKSCGAMPAMTVAERKSKSMCLANAQKRYSTCLHPAGKSDSPTSGE